MSTGTELPVFGVAPPVRNERWLRAARRDRLLSWFSLAWMTVEGAVGIAAGIVEGLEAWRGDGCCA